MRKSNTPTRWMAWMYFIYCVPFHSLSNTPIHSQLTSPSTHSHFYDAHWSSDAIWMFLWHSVNENRKRTDLKWIIESTTIEALFTSNVNAALHASFIQIWNSNRFFFCSELVRNFVKKFRLARQFSERELVSHGLISMPRRSQWKLSHKAHST